MRAHKQRKAVDEVEARAATVRFLNGEGPLPDHVIFNIPGDEEKMERRMRVHPRRSDDPKVENESLWTVLQIKDFEILGKDLRISLLNQAYDRLTAQTRDRLTAANESRRKRVTTWRQAALIQAKEHLKRPGVHRRSACQLAMKLCGADAWAPEAEFSVKWEGPQGKTLTVKISADTLSRFLSEQFSFPLPPLRSSAT